MKCKYTKPEELDMWFTAFFPINDIQSNYSLFINLQTAKKCRNIIYIWKTAERENVLASLNGSGLLAKQILFLNEKGVDPKIRS